MTDPAAAGAAAAEAALCASTASSPALVLVFCASGYDHAALLDAICLQVPDDVPVVGCTTNGELVLVGPDQDTPGWQPGVVVVVIGGAGFVAHTAVRPDASSDRHGSGAAAAAVMERIDAPHRTLLMLADGLTREQHELVRGAYSVVGLDVPVVGACSADDQDYAVTRQFHGTGAGVQVYSDAVVAVGLGSSGPFGIGIAHGWTKQGEPMLVTSSEGGEVRLLDGEPALDAYLNVVGEDRALLDDPKKFHEIAFAHPLGMSRRSGEDIRVVHGTDAEHGTVHCLADVPQGALVWQMTSDVESLIRAAEDSARSAVAGLGGREPLGFVVFDCGARKLRLGREHLGAEQEALAAVAAGRPLGGFYTYGEIARTQGSRGMHHFTVVTLALA